MASLDTLVQRIGLTGFRIKIGELLDNSNMWEALM